MERREFVLGCLALGLSGCAPSGPGVVTVLAQGVAGMNPGPGGEDRPLTLQIVQLRSAGAFDSVDFFALQNPAAALGAEFIKADQVALTAGGPKTLTIGLDAGTTVIGVIAGFRDPAGKTFRGKIAVSATESVTLAVAVTKSGVTLRAG
ncbi:type VI secretion system lipoprotein TssJ [Xinfangfangia sp. CPCC 101601]|uniref:Type VI secretion system lipoprotein TssJ n=1 Tax=Pseudogemmobacter lacusdianii TaxID=3069608 RepID=A0ABU0VVB5_9RHOB|nr:type VI secretion system lipoprotein TssJ [Xinfangfangia sp. CPCC 101601]MDQ2065696.1 type VI secretion system lipoprotein TssJ [Xinfangfangia sp. CPCC 101601]